MPLEHCKQLLFLTMLLRQHHEVVLALGPIERLQRQPYHSRLVPLTAGLRLKDQILIL